MRMGQQDFSSSSPWGPMHLARLGCMLGIQEWVTPLTDTFTFQKDCVTVVAPLVPSAMRDELLGDDDEEEDEEEEVGVLSLFAHVRLLGL